MEKKTEIDPLLLEQLLLDEVPAKIKKALLLSHPELQKKLDGLKVSDQEILNTYMSSKMAAEIHQKFNHSSSTEENNTSLFKKPLFYYLTPVLASAMGLFVSFLLFYQTPQAPTERIKGLKPTLLIYKKTPEGNTPMSRDENARAGDLLQIAYNCPENKKGVIISLDGRGVITWHLPDEQSAPIVFERNKKTILPNSYKLDDAPLFEKFFMIYVSENFDVSLVKKALNDIKDDPTKSLTLPSGYEYSEFNILK